MEKPVEECQSYVIVEFPLEDALSFMNFTVRWCSLLKLLNSFLQKNSSLNQTQVNRALTLYILPFVTFYCNIKKKEKSSSCSEHSNCNNGAYSDSYDCATM